MSFKSLIQDSYGEELYKQINQLQHSKVQAAMSTNK